MLVPSRDEFLRAATGGNLIPVYREILADVETPISAFWKLGGGAYSFLLESAEKGERYGRYSFVGSDPLWVMEVRGGRVLRRERQEGGGYTQREHAAAGDPLEELRRAMDEYRPVEVPGLPLFYGGAVGYLAFEAVRYFEPTVPMAAKDDLGVADACFMLSDTLVIFDHQERRMKLVACARVRGDAGAAYDEAAGKIAELERRLCRPLPALGCAPVTPRVELAPQANMTKDEYVGMTLRMKEYIAAGDIFQVVPSQRFSVPFPLEPLQLFRALRLVNPSPYMFLLKMGDSALVGSSPEMHVRCERDRVELHPIAGTRPRRSDPREDAQMEDDLLADPKERAEHVMLVDLGRNDLGRVCEYDTVRVTDFMSIERYSHVMHIVSHVTGRLRKGHTAYDVMRATFPAGTVSGAPKVRAMQIIAEGEPTRRGIYSGAVGYFGFSGNLDSCIAIRTVLVKDGRAHVQAGGGLVADSTPEGEYQESVNKARAALKALALACSMPPLPESVP